MPAGRERRGEDAIRVSTHRGGRGRGVQITAVIEDPAPEAKVPDQAAATIPDDDVVYRVDVMAEQFPHPESKVSLSASLDPIGLQRPVLNWRIDDLNMSSLRRAYDVFGQQVTRTGFGEFVPSLDTENVPVSGGYHHMGTTRMHPEETQGVVDTQGRVHGTSNLYACGSSVFPTSGVSNPTLTIVALSFRLADHLVHCL